MTAARWKFGRLDPPLPVPANAEQPLPFNATDIPHSYPPRFAIEKLRSTVTRIVIGLGEKQIQLLGELASILLNAPYHILYVLVVARGGREEGRYQMSTPLDRQGLEAFLLRWRQFLEQDGRHHLWVASPPDPTFLVYDRHNVMYVYGDIERTAAVLRRLGYSEGSVTIPAPHVHHYHAECDTDEKELLSAYEWRRVPLRDGDRE